jgi:hypothetical protein
MPAFVNEMSAVVGEKRWRNGLRRWGLQSNVSLRFTKNNPATLKLYFATPRLISAYERCLGATDCNREARHLEKDQRKLFFLVHFPINVLKGGAIFRHSIEYKSYKNFVSGESKI